MDKDLKERLMRAEMERIVKENTHNLNLRELMEYNVALVCILDFVHGMQPTSRLAVLNTIAQYEATKQGIEK